MNKELYQNIDLFINKLSFTSYIKERFKILLIRYEYCRLNKLYHYPLIIDDKIKFNKHLVGFLDGDGTIRSGKRVGKNANRFRFAPNITLELIFNDLNYLNLIKKELLLENKKIYVKNEKKVTLIFGNKKELELIMNIIDNNQSFLSQRRSRDYLLFKKLINYINNTELITHDLTWLNKGLEILKDFNTYNNLSSNENILNDIKKKLSIDYIIGFIEAEGSFVLHYNTKKNYIFNSFEITQNKANNLILWAILEYIKEYNDPLIIKENVEIKTKGIVEDNSVSRKQTLSRLTLTNNDVLFNKIIPLMLSSDFYSKKQINLIYWIFGVIICKNLKNHEECVNLYFEIKNVINTNNNELLDLNKILIILNKFL